MKTIAEQLNITDFPFTINDKHGREIYYEVPSGWAKREFDNLGNQIYFENSAGRIINDRLKPVELTLQQIADKFDIELKLLRIKK